MARRIARILSTWTLALLSIGCLAASADGASLPRWSAPRLVDHVAPFAYVWELQGLSCPSASLCVGVGGSHIVSSNEPTSGEKWSAASVDARDLRAISCPSESLCVAVDGSGDLLSSSEPTGSAKVWSRSVLTTGELTDVACPSTGVCIATGYPAGIFISTNPTGGSAAWTSLAIPGQGYPEHLACPTVSMCVAVNNEGGVVWLALDSSGHAQWDGTWIAPDASRGVVRGLSCPSARLCVAVDDDGDVIASTTPTAVGSPWSITRIDSAPLRGVSCASESMCVALDTQGDVTASTRRADGVGAWSEPMNVDPSAGNILPGGGPLVAPGILNPTGWIAQAISCPIATLCVALDRYGHSITSDSPTAGASSWHLTTASEGADGFAAISCPDSLLCAGIDDAGRVVSSTDPDSPHATWRVTTVPGLADAYEWGIACIGRPLCVAFDRSYSGGAGHYQSQQAFASIDPNGGPSTWRPMKAPGYHVGSLPNTTETSCPWKTICLTWRKVAGAPTSVIITAHKRGARGHTQSYLPIYGGSSCPSASFCASVGPVGEHNGELSPGSGPSGELYTSAHPTASSKWRASHIDAMTLAGISCPTTRLCVAFDSGGNILSSTNPTSARAKWKIVHLSGAGSLTELACSSTHLCVGRDNLGNVVMTTIPTGNASAWTVQPLDLEGSITSLACPSAHACVAADEAGDVLLGLVPR